MAKVAVGPDTANDEDLLSAAAGPAEEPPAPPRPEIDPRDQQILEMRAENLQLQAQLAAKPGTAPTGGEVATPAAIANRLNREQVFKTEFDMYDGVELGDGLHESFCRQTREQAIAAGYTTRGGAHRVGWGSHDGIRTAQYEIFARK